MLNTAFFTLLLSSSLVTARHQWFERDNKRPVFLHPRRFGQQNPALLNELGSACPGQFCGTLAGEAVAPLLAGAAECTQQQHADKIIDTAQQFDAATKAKMIEIAIAYRQLEKNTPPDFTTNPPSLRNSVFCQEAPKNPELNGLVQAQDPANDPDLFFDPKTKLTVRKGEQANTAPFGGAAATPPANNAGNDGAAGNDGEDNTGDNTGNDAASSSCAATVTVTATGGAVASPSGAVTVTAGNPPATTSAPAPPDAGNAGDIGDFGSCSVPEIEFGQGFDGRRETSFRPVDRASYNHGSAQNIAIITRAICDQLVNTCKADDTAKATCQEATEAAAAAQPPKAGIQADAFNAVFGKTTNFAAVTAFDDQGRPVPGTGNVDNGNAGNGNTGNGDAATPPPATGGNGLGDFGKCTPPQLEFGPGFDGRKETAFRPVDLVSFPKGSAQNGAIITEFMCDQLINNCGADATALATCATAEAEFLKGPPKAGLQADLFNAVFGVKTNFAAVDVIDNQGNVVQAGNGNAGNGNAGNDNNNENENNGGAASTTAAPPAATAPAPAAGNLQGFTGALGGVVAPAVTDIGGGRFQVEGNASFNNLESALVRSCDVHNNQCANAANASGNQNGFNVGACNQQQQQCIALARA